ncbi:hypothetical protein QQ045_007760 [Rhodiola kirilowii]
MDPNNNPFNTQNSSNYPFNYQNPNNYQFQNQSSNQQRPQNMPNYGFAPNFNMPSSIPNFHPFYGSMMQYPSQGPSYNPYMPMGNETVPNVGATEFPEFSTQMAIGDMTSANEVTPNVEEDVPNARKKSPRWTTEQNLVLLSGWIKYGTNSVVDLISCRNHFNYINKILGKWIGAYDNAKRMQRSGWSENDVLVKAQELYSTCKTVPFNLMEEWHAVRDQPRYCSQVGGNTGSESSGSKRSHESDSNSVGTSARPMGREAAKNKGKKKSKEVALEAVNEDRAASRQIKEKELERLDMIAVRQAETNQLIKERTMAKKTKMFMKLSAKENLDDQHKELLERLNRELFGN